MAICKVITKKFHLLKFNLNFTITKWWKYQKASQIAKKKGTIVIDIYLWCGLEAKDQWNKAKSKQSSILKPKILLEVPLLFQQALWNSPLQTHLPFSSSSTKDSNFDHFIHDKPWKLYTLMINPLFCKHNLWTQHQNSNCSLHSMPNGQRCRKTARGSMLNPILFPLLELCVVALKYLKRVQWNCVQFLFWEWWKSWQS